MVCSGGEDFRYEPDTDPYICPAIRGCCESIRTIGTVSLRKLFAEVTLHTGSETWPGSASVRGRSGPDARTSDARSDEAPPIRCRASFCNDQVPYLRASSVVDARVIRRTSRDQPCLHGLQHQAHDECARRSKPYGSSPAGLSGTASHRENARRSSQATFHSKAIQKSSSVTVSFRRSSATAFENIAVAASYSEAS